MRKDGLRESLKSGGLSGFYAWARGWKRRLRREPLAGIIPVQTLLVSLEALCRAAPLLADHSRVQFSIALHYIITNNIINNTNNSSSSDDLNSIPNSQDSDTSTMMARGLEYLRHAETLKFEAPERLCLYRGLAWFHQGHTHAAQEQVLPLQPCELTPEEQEIRALIIADADRKPDDKFEIPDQKSAQNVKLKPNGRIDSLNDSSAKAPRVSVILPNYNYARYLKERVRSILNQTMTDFEIIYVDDASSDESNALMQEFTADPRVRTLCFERNSGCVYQRWNDGAALASGAWLWFAGADDTAHPRFLENLLALAETYPDAAILHSNRMTIDSQGRLLQLNAEHLGPGLQQHLSHSHCATGLEEIARLTEYCYLTTASAMLLRADVFHKYSGFDVRLWQAADWDLYLTMLRDHDIAYDAEPLMSYRAHAQTVTKTTGHVTRALENAYCVARAYHWAADEPRCTNAMRSVTLRQVKARIFDIFTDPAARLPEHLHFAAEEIYKAVPDRRLRRL